MPTIQLGDPLSAASEAIGNFATAKRDNELQAQAQQMAQQQQAMQAARDKATIDNQVAERSLNEQKFTYQQGQDTVANQQAQAKAELDARRESDLALHNARRDAIDQARQRATDKRDDQKFKLDVAKINQTYKIEQQKLHNATSVAEIRASATMGAAQIHAAASIEAAGIRSGATLQAAGMREAGADRRETKREGVAKDLLGIRESHQDSRASGTIRQSSKNALRGAMLRLSLNKNGAPVPGDDANFQQHLSDYMKLSPQGRDLLIQNGNLPDSTKKYLHALGPLLQEDVDEGE